MKLISRCIHDCIQSTIDLYGGQVSYYEISLMKETLVGISRMMLPIGGRQSVKSIRKLVSLFMEANLMVMQFDMDRIPFEQIVNSIVFMFGSKAFVKCKRPYRPMPSIEEDIDC
jgi:predicted transcriptional regulator